MNLFFNWTVGNTPPPARSHERNNTDAGLLPGPIDTSTTTSSGNTEATPESMKLKIKFKRRPVSVGGKNIDLLKLHGLVPDSKSRKLSRRASISNTGEDNYILHTRRTRSSPNHEKVSRPTRVKVKESLAIEKDIITIDGGLIIIRRNTKGLPLHECHVALTGDVDSMNHEIIVPSTPKYKTGSQEAQNNTFYDVKNIKINVLLYLTIE